MKVVIVGGGPAGCSAAVSAKRLGADVVLIERMNRLGGLGTQAGIYWFPVADVALTEDKELGGGDLFDLLDSIAVHRKVQIPHWTTISTYNIMKLDSRLQKALIEKGIKLMLNKRAVDIRTTGNAIDAVVFDKKQQIEGDVFIDTSGANAGMTDCSKWGYGCVGCSLQCAVFGPCGGIVEKKAQTVAIQSDYAMELGHWGTLGSSVMLSWGSLSAKHQKELEEKGYIQIKVAPTSKPNLERARRTEQLELVKYGNEIGFLGDHITIVDVGKTAKLTTISAPLYVHDLRNFHGLEEVVTCDPIAGDKGHAVHKTRMAIRDNLLKVEGFSNLFCAGNKAGSFRSILDAMITGELAGYNAARLGCGKPCIEFPKSMAIGAFIDYTGNMLRNTEGRRGGYSLLNPNLLKSMDVYRVDNRQIIDEVKNIGLSNIYQRQI